MFSFITKLKRKQGTLGIEISDRSIKLAEIVPLGNHKYSLEKFLIESLPDQVVDDGRIKDPIQVVRILQNMMAKLNVTSKHVHLILPSQSIMVRFLKLPDIPLKDLRKLVEFEMKFNIHLPFDAPVFDFVKLNGNLNASASKPERKKKTKVGKKKANQNKFSQVDRAQQEAAAATSSSELDKLFANTEADKEITVSSNQCDVMLVAAPTELIQEYEAVVTSASLKPLSMEFKALALYRLMELTQMTDLKSTLMTIDINELVTDVSIFHDQQLKITRSMPMDFGVKSEDDDASATDRMFLEFIDVDENFKNSCKDLSSEIERLLNFYRYTLNNRNQEFSHIFISGDAERLTEIAQILAERLPGEISVMSTDRIQSSQANFSEAFPSLAVSIGLALRGNER